MWSQRFLILALAAAAVVAPACNDDKSTNPTTSVLAFLGIVNGDDGVLSGSITLTVTGSTVAGSFDVVMPAAATHVLAGSYNAATKALSATGGGYNFAGVFDGANRLEGTLSGSASGTFVAVKDDNNSAEAFCGTFTGDDDGVWNFTVRGSSLAGTATTTTGTVVPLEGSVSGNNITVANPGGGATLATGTRSGNSVGGTWDNGQGSTGTWTGSACH